MPKSKKALKPDTVLKNYWRDNEQYASSNGLEENEYLSRMKKPDKFTPVITVVIYYGEKPWDGAVSLHEMLNITEEMAPYVNDYKILLAEARKNDLKLHNINNVDLFNMLEILINKDISVKEAREKAIAYAKERHVERSVIMTVAGVAN